MTESSSPGALRLASFNVRKCVGTDRRRDGARVLRVIAGLRADIVALQEVDHRLGARHATLDPKKIRERTGLVPLSLNHSEVSLGWHGNALLLSPRVRPRRVLPIDLPGLEPRGAVLAELDDGTAVMRIVAVHLGLRRSDRKRQLAAIRTQLDGLPPAPTAILGDFNEWSERRGLGRLADQFAIHAPGASWHARVPVAPLDRIALSRDLALLRAGVEDGPLARRASDHLPIWADVAARAPRSASPLREEAEAV